MRVQLNATLEATIYDRPGEWMDDGELAALRGEIRTLADSAIPGALHYGVFLPERAPFRNRLVVVGRDTRTGQVVGLNAMPQLDVTLEGKPARVLHLGLIVIHPAHQRKGLQGLLYGLGGFSALHRLGSRVWISSVSEVPAVIGAVADHFSDVFPSHRSSSRPTPTHRALAEQIMARHRHEFGVGPDAVFDAERFVIQGSYTGGSDALKKSFASAPKHRSPEVNALCEVQLDYQRGDDFLQLGTFDAGTVTRWLGHRVPEGFRPAAARRMRLWTYPAQKATP